MIQNALQFTKDTLNQFLKNTFGLDDTSVVCNSIIDADGSIPKINQNKVVISLINLESETSKPFYTRNVKLQDGDYTNTAPVNRFNLDILVTSNFDDYSETLKFLNEIILFFQVNVSISSGTSSNIPKGIEKLEFEMEKLSFHEMHNLWNALGAKYQPSVVYKMRLVTLNPEEISGFNTEESQTINTIK